ncbi:MAG: ATP-binding cassette domain-containing protein [Actinomycetes bacterium]|jgi:D-methionine transport system ATP-binding protein|nr:ATP-binding cassette domain-containing protein [Actinomycetes bacterium]
MKTAAIEIRGLSKSFTVNGEASEVLRDVSLTVAPGDIYGIIGRSGAGKSTLARCVNLLERPTAGQVFVSGQDVTHFAGRDLLDLRARIGMVFQDFNLFAQRTVLSNVSFPLEIRHDGAEARRARAQELLELVGLSDKAQSWPSQLSGGQQQRVAIARALANHPSIMLCDEVTSALDTTTTQSILDLLRNINRELGVTMLVITHAMSVVHRICNKVAVLDAGRVVETGTVADLFAHPQAAATRELLRADNGAATAVIATAAAATPTATRRPQHDAQEAGADHHVR